MSVGTGSLKRTAKSVGTPKEESTRTQEQQTKKTEPVRTRKTSTRTSAAKTTVKKAAENETFTSGIKCELPEYLL